MLEEIIVNKKERSDSGDKEKERLKIGQKNENCNETFTKGKFGWKD